jgi:hypothetical protein
MMILTMLTLLGLAPLAQDQPPTLEGPARFCGYSPIIDLLPGETVTVLEGGIHAGSFRWEGAFGALEVHGIGWASRPPGQVVRARTESRPARLSQRREEDVYVVAIWNGAEGAAYFRSPSRLTPDQIAAIDRVALYQEGETPAGCDLRTRFVWG